MPKFIALGWLTLVWLATVYLQRFVALTLIGRRVGLAAFLLEPFCTQLFHFCAMTLIIYGAVRSAFGERRSAWATRAR